MQLITLQNQSGLTVELADYGARLIDVRIPGDLSLVSGYEHTNEYLSDTAYMGATVGPIANRIRHGRLTISGQTYSLEKNFAGHSLHSGVLSFAHRFWEITEQTTRSATFRLDFAPALEGRAHMLPGKQRIFAKYELIENQIVLSYSADTDQNTYLNLTNHCYWNLNTAGSGQEKADIRNHHYCLHTVGYAEKDTEDIPIGNIRLLSTPFDFKFGDARMPDNLREQADHHFIVDKRQTVDADGCRLMASVVGNHNAVKLQVSGTQPGFQFYTGQFLPSPFKPFGGFCIEPQYMPDAINIDSAESPLTTPHKPYQQIIKYQLDWPR